MAFTMEIDTHSRDNEMRVRFSLRECVDGVWSPEQASFGFNLPIDPDITADKVKPFVIETLEAILYIISNAVFATSTVATIDMTQETVDKLLKAGVSRPPINAKPAKNGLT